MGSRVPRDLSGVPSPRPRPSPAAEHSLPLSMSFLTSRTAFPPNQPLSFETATHVECGSAKTKRKVLILTQKSGLLRVLWKRNPHNPPRETGHWGCRGDLKYRFATVLNESAPRAKRGEGCQSLKPCSDSEGEKKRSEGEHPSAMGRQGH